MKKVIKQLFCRHKKLHYMYSENLSTETVTTTAEIDLYQCKVCGKYILKG